VYAAADSLLKYKEKQYKMLLRKSQVKFTPPDSTKIELRVVSSTDEAHRSLFFESSLKALEDSGAETDGIEKIFDDAYDHLTNASSDSLEVLPQILRVSDGFGHDGVDTRHHLLKVAIQLNKNFAIRPEDYPNSFLDLYLTKLGQLSRDRNMFRVPIPGSCSVLSLTDDNQILEPREVIVRAHGHTICGPILLYRDPIIHIRDIQEARAISEGEIKRRVRKKHSSDADKRIETLSLSQMMNVIFFSQMPKQGKAPLTNQLAGGDLDGDRYEVLTKDCGFWGPGYGTSEPADYTEGEMSRTEAVTSIIPSAATALSIDRVGAKSIPIVSNKGEPFDVAKLASFIGDYIRNDCFDVLQERLMCMVDEKQEGMKDKDVKKLSPWLSKAVDYAKSGKEVDLVENVLSKTEFRVTKTPDFIRALKSKAFYDSMDDEHDCGKNSVGDMNNFDDSTSVVYDSPNLLGKIYRKHQEETVSGPMDM
jgi:hypothetical protein